MSETSPVRDQNTVMTPGATRAGNGKYLFNMKTVNSIMGGPEYSPVYGSCVEGDRLIVALMKAPAGKMGDRHSHPNEQWIFVLEGEFELRLDGQTNVASVGEIIYIPADMIHQGGATAKGDALFFTCKDASHALAGKKVAD